MAPSDPEPAKPEVGGSSQNVTDHGPDAKRPRLDGAEAAPVAEHPASAVAGSGSSSASLPTPGNNPAAAIPASDDGMDEIAALKRTVRDPDALFALSVAEALKRLPMEGKATLKIAIMEVVAEIRTAEKPSAAVTNGTAVSAPPETAAQAERSAVPVEQVDISKPPPSVTGNVEEDNLSEAFFIGEEEAAAASRTREAVEESEPPLAPPVKKQCVPKSAPFADQLADAKARAAAMAREAAEQSRAAREMHLHVPPPGYGPPPPAGAAPNGSVPPPGPPAGAAPGWPSQVSGPVSGQPAGWGRPLPAPAAAMPRGEPLQRAAAERRHRSPVRRFRR
ncbi:hypothetical protein FJT64_011910 [Amphibalanus amphitrite]|uniref:BESS domain-containing protein n=1 Tax=Amphibalanus amphitrite TaxID=1232801 RepID=A0A6A4V5N5_AMPAM|nr:hypothetical protein FJT64_011910 [Amphibalanus amphitrite]